MEQHELELVVERTAAGDAASWRALWAEIEPWLAKLVANPQFLGRIGQREDDRNNILIEVMARLHADAFHRLALYCGTRRANPQLRFKTWLRVVVKRVGIDYLRAHQNYVRAGQGWVEAGTLPPHSRLGGERPPITDHGTALELLRYAAESVPEPGLSALGLWTQSAGFDDIARRLDLASAADAERLVRAALERIRRRFRDEVG